MRLCDARCDVTLIPVNYDHVSVAINTSRLSIDSQIVIASKTPGGVQVIFSDAGTNERLSCTNSSGGTDSSGRTNPSDTSTNNYDYPTAQRFQ